MGIDLHRVHGSIVLPRFPFAAFPKFWTVFWIWIAAGDWQLLFAFSLWWKLGKKLLKQKVSYHYPKSKPPTRIHVVKCEYYPGWFRWNCIETTDGDIWDLGFCVCNSKEYRLVDIVLHSKYLVHTCHSCLPWLDGQIQTPNSTAKNTIKSPLYRIEIDHQCITLKDSSMFCPYPHIAHVRILSFCHNGNLIHGGCKGGCQCIIIHIWCCWTVFWLKPVYRMRNSIPNISKTQRLFTKHMDGHLCSFNQQQKPSTMYNNEKWMGSSCMFSL